MRMFSRAGGKHPPVNLGARHIWTLDEANPTDFARDIMGTASLSTVNGPPSVVASPVGFTGRNFNGAATYIRDVTTFPADATALGNMTVMGAFRLGTGFAAAGAVWSFGDSVTGTIGKVRVNASRQLEFVYTDTLLGTVTVTDPKVLVLGRWYTFAVVRAQAATATVTIYLEGGRSSQTTGLNLVKGTSANATYQIGCDVPAGLGERFNGDIAGVGLYHVRFADSQVEDMLSAMRMLAFDTSLYVDVQVRDGQHNTGPINFVSLTALRRVDFVKSVAFSQDVDNKIGTCTVTLVREVGDMQLGRYHDNVLNRLPIAGTPGTTTYASTAELLGLNRPIRILVDRRALGSGFAQDQGTPNYSTIFEGQIDKVDWGGDGNEITVECRDMGAQLMDCFIPVTSVRSTAGGTPVQTVMQGIITDAKGNAPPASYANNWGLPNTNYYVGAFWDLSVPINPGWNIRQYRLQPQPVLQALNNLAEQIGWTVRALFDQGAAAGAGAWRMHFYEPDRNQPFPNHVLLEGDVQNASEVAVAIEDIRNEVWVAFAPNSTVPQPMVVPVIPSGTGTIAAGSFYYGAPGSYAVASTSQGEEDNRVIFRVRSQDLHATEEGQTSQTVYGNRRMMVAEASSSNIDTPAEAQRFAVAMLRDLQQPKIAATLRLAGMPELELGDMLKLRANGQWSTSDQQMAVVSLALEFTRDGAWTTVQMRGRPTNGSSVHLDREARPGVAPVPTVDNEQGEMQAGMTTRQRRQVHQGLMDIGAQYMRTARQNSSVRNPDFAMRTQGERPPDSWGLTAGTWNTDAQLVNNASESGRYAVRFNNITGRLRSDWTPVAASQGHFVEVRAKPLLTPPNAVTLFIGVEWYTRDRVLISSASNTTMSTGPLDWQTYMAEFTAPATAAFARAVCGIFSWSGLGGLFVDWCNVMSPTYAFRAERAGLHYTLTDNIAVASTCVFNSVSFNYGILPASVPPTPYAPATGVFTAPRPGFYRFEANVLVRSDILGGAAMQSFAGLVVAGNVVAQTNLYIGDTARHGTLTSGLVRLNTLQTAYVTVNAAKSGGGVPQLRADPGSNFSGRLVYLD